MFTIRSARRAPLLSAVSGVLLATMALTACEGDNSAGDGASASASAGDSQDKPASSTGGSSGGSTGGTSGGTSGGSGGSQGGAGSPEATSAPDENPDSRTVCTGSVTRTVATVTDRPLNHLLLTVTNTGSSTCDLYHYPAVRFGEAQSVPPVIEESKPQAVVSLKPGESGYAAVVLSAGDGSGTGPRTEKSLDVNFYGRSGEGSVGEPARPALPAGGVHIDDSLKVTYWQQSMGDALEW